LNCGAGLDDTPEAKPVEPDKMETREIVPPLDVPQEAAVAAPSAPRVQAAETQRKSATPTPTWLLTILFFFAILGIGSAVYYGIQYFRSDRQSTSTGLDSAANTARTKLTSPLQKSIEVVGIRLVENKNHKPEARFVVVNHSNTEIAGLAATVTIWASTARSEEDSVGTFQFKLPAIGPYESENLNAPFSTKLKMSELPDWQNATPDVQITSP
jgi:hypothetical protein